jgi:hypothetical protein
MPSSFFCLGWAQTMILLISASQVGGITSMSHHAIELVTESSRAFEIFKGSKTYFHHFKNPIKTYIYL